MSAQIYILAVALVAAFALTLIVSFKSKHFFSSVFLTAVSGTGALFAVNMLSSVTGVSIALNYITLSVSAFLGMPGVISLVISQIILK